LAAIKAENKCFFEQQSGYDVWLEQSTATQCDHECGTNETPEFVEFALSGVLFKLMGGMMGRIERIKKPLKIKDLFYIMAEAVRFELTNGSHRRQFSRLVPSTARPRFLQTRIIHKSSCLR
jgi:hypothetical protein